MATRFFPNYDKNLITSEFGNRKSGFHTGIDFNGTNDGVNGHTDYVMAHTGGVVSYVGYSESAGWQIFIDVDNDTTMVYYHLQEGSIKVKQGQSVKQGEIIGHSGASGKVTGAHLHFGIKVKGEWIDPKPYLDKDYPVKVPETGTEVEYERVQIGSFILKSNAVRRAKEVKAKGYPAIIKKYGLNHRVQVGAYTNHKNAVYMLNKMKELGYKDAYITKESGVDVPF